MSEEQKELEVLFPDQEILLAGEMIVVRELRLGEEMRHHAALSAIADAFAVFAEDKNMLDDQAINYIIDFLGQNWAQVAPVLSASCGKPVEWIESLSSKDGATLLMTWWNVSKDFFVRRLLLPMMVKQAKLRGDVSSLSSSGTDTTGGESADATRGGRWPFSRKKHSGPKAGIMDAAS